MKLLLNHCKGHYHHLVLGPLFKLFEAILELMVPLLMANIIDVGIKTGDRAYVLRQGGLLVLLAVLGIAAGLVCQYFASVAAFGFGASLRRNVFEHILTLSPQETDSIGTGSLITRITNDVTQAQNGLNLFVRLATRAPFLVVGSLVMAFRINAQVACIFLVTTPLIVAVLYWIMKRTLPDYARIQQKQDTLGALAGETLEGARVIRAFSRQESERQDFAQASQEHSQLTIHVGRFSGALNPLTYLIANLGILGLLWFGAQATQQGVLLSGDVFALVNYMTQTLLALIVLANLIVQFTRAIASGKRISQLLNTQPSIQDGDGAKARQSQELVQFRQVEFAYNQGRPALSGLNFSIQKGQTVGIIGGTGCGKTTLAKLLLRFYDVTSGEILFNGQDVRRYRLQDLRACIGYVPQAVNLFSGTIRSNLKLGAPNATDQQLWRALELAQGKEFVEQTAQGLDTPVEEGGKNFSGGQRQRLTIARALAKQPELLILDDSSSALDYATDAALRQSLRTGTQGATVVLISQRASTIRHADLILVLDGGRIVGQGTHEQLLQSCPVYQEICISQKLVSPQQTAANQAQEVIL